MLAKQVGLSGFRQVAGMLVVAAVVSLSGCSTMTMAPSVAVANPGFSLRGTVHGGQQPLTGASVYLLAAGTGGYKSASSSLLNTVSPNVNVDSLGNGYVVTDASGSFTITNDWSCVNGSDQIYLLVTGGNPGLPPGTNNTAISMLEALGTCSSINGTTTVVVNEVTTVAAVMALHRFMADGLHIATSSTNMVGLTNAFANAANLVDLNGVTARTTTRGGNGTIPQAMIHTMANIMASCVNSAGPTSTPCQSMFSAAVQSGYSAPTDLVSTLMLMGVDPSSSTAPLFNLSTAVAPFQPSLTAPPTAWLVPIKYSLGVPTPLPAYLAIDGAGNVWVSNLASQKLPAGTDSIIELSPTGAIMSGAGGYTSGISGPQGLAIDDTGNVWVANTLSNVTKLSSSGVVASGFPLPDINSPKAIALDVNGNAWVSEKGNNSVTEIPPGGVSVLSVVTSPGFTSPHGIAIDPSGSVWVAGKGSNSLLKLSSTGAVQSGNGAGYTGGGLNQPSGLVVDGSGNVWVANSTGGTGTPSISEFSGSGVAITTAAGYGAGTAGYENLLAVDGKGEVISASCGMLCVGSGTDNIISIKSNGVVGTGPNGVQGPFLDGPQSIAVDASGDVWIGNTGGQGNAIPGDVTVVLGVISPVKTPLQAALKSGLLGQLP